MGGVSTSGLPWPPLPPSRWQDNGEKKLLRFLPERPQRGMVGLDRGELTPSRSPSARPSLVDRPDRLCPRPKFAPRRLMEPTKPRAVSRFR